MRERGYQAKAKQNNNPCFVFKPKVNLSDKVQIVLICMFFYYYMCNIRRIILYYIITLYLTHNCMQV